MAIGSYRDRVGILKRVLASPDSFGERVEEWSNPPEWYWGRIEGPAGGEQPEAPRQSTNSLRVRFRNVAPLEAVDRLEVGGEVYAVVGVWQERAEHGGWQTVADLSGTY